MKIKREAFDAVGDFLMALEEELEERGNGGMSPEDLLTITDVLFQEQEIETDELIERVIRALDETVAANAEPEPEPVPLKN